MLYKTILFIVFCVLFANSFLQADFAYAAENDNMFGFAWSETFGWIMFNSDARVRDMTNPDTGERGNQLLDFGIPVSASEDDAYDDGVAAWPDYSNTEDVVRAGRIGSNILYSGFRWTGLGIPPAASIASVIAKLRYHDFLYEPNTDIAFELNTDPLSFSSTDSPYHRWAGAHTLPETFNLVTQSGFTDIPPATWILTPDLTSGLQDIMGLSTVNPRIINDVVLLESGTPGLESDSFAWTAYDYRVPRDVMEIPPVYIPKKYGAARLYVEYKSGGKTYDFTFNAGIGEDFGIQVDPITGFFTSTNPNGTGAYAWSSNLGWIKFNPDTNGISPPPPSYNTHPARMNMNGDASICGGTIGAICGWARVCSAVADKVTCEDAADLNAGGWDGWIYLGAGPGLSYDDNTETINGWAWGGNADTGEGIGWISFNNYTGADITPGGITFPTSFLTLNAPPQAVNLVDGHFTGPENCGLNYSPMVVQWDFYDPNFGDEPAAFQVVARNTTPGDCVLNFDVNSCTSGPQIVGGTCKPTNTDSPPVTIPPDGFPNGTCRGDHGNSVNPCLSNPRPTATATGFVSITNGNSTVSDSGSLPQTKFQTEVQAGDRVTIGSDVQNTRTVVSITSDTLLTVNNPFSATLSNEEMRLNVPQFIDCKWIVSSADMNPSPPGHPHPNFFTTYYWAVRAKDNDEFEPAWSVWAGLDANGNGLESFVTRRHKYPGPSIAAPAIPINPLFSMVPLEPSVGEVVEFTEDSICYWSSHTGALNQRYQCSETAFENFGGDAPFNLNNRYQWDLNGDRDFDDLDDCDSDTDPSCRENMPVTYTYNNIRLDVPVTLRVTDKYIETTYDGGGYCDFKHDLFSVFPRTIQWREISPF